MSSLAETTLVLGAYLLGSVPFALLLGKTRGVDIRAHGSGNIGATNLGRALGRKWAIGAFLLDFLKGFGPVLAARIALAGRDDDLGARLPWIELEVCAAAILGHVFPVYLRFKGGKGVATAFGAMTGLEWSAAVSCGAIWAVIYKVTRTVSVASIGAGVAFPLAVWVVHVVHTGHEISSFAPRLLVASAVAILIVVRHRSNIVRLLRGEELAFRRKDADESGEAP